MIFTQPSNNKLLAIRYILCTILVVLAAQSRANGIYYDAAIGVGSANPALQHTYFPVPDFENAYHKDSGNNTVKIITLEGGYPFHINNNYSTNIGIEVGYLDYGNNQGTVRPGINLLPDADTLHYTYNLKSYLFLATVGLDFNRTWLPNVNVGAGVGINTLSDYDEVPNGEIRLEKMFASKRTYNFSYTVGADIYKKQFRKVSFSVGYRFFNTGKGCLKGSQYGGDICVKDISVNAIVLTASF